MKKVLVIGPDFYDYNHSVKRAFQKLGFEAKTFDYSGSNLTNVAEKVLFKLTLHSEKYFTIKRRLTNNAINKLYDEYKPDIVFIIHGWYLFDETVARMKNSRNILWLMDSIDRYGAIHSLPDLMDYNFFFERTDIEKMKQAYNKESWFLPLALDEDVYYPIDLKKEIDISFVGFLFEKRVFILERLIKEFKNLNIKIYGTVNRGQKDIYALVKKYPDAFMLRNISPKEVNVVYNTSKICLNIHHDQSVYGVNQRFFESSGSGNFQLVDANEFIDENFEKDMFATYKNDSELFSQISFYLDAEAERERMKNTAYKEILAKHTFTKRIEYVLSVINN